MESHIFTENGIIEIFSVVILILCLLRCLQFAVQSRLRISRSFWLAGVLTFFAILRRELNHVPELFIDQDAQFLGFTYDWWEDTVQLIVYIVLLGLLIYARRYLWRVLKQVPISLYLVVASLALVQYLGENAIIASYETGAMIEELAEMIIYSIALIYLLRMTPDTSSELPKVSNTSKVTSPL